MKILLDISPLVVDNLTGIGNYVYSLTKEVLKNDTRNEYFLFCFSPLNKIEKMQHHEFTTSDSVSGITVCPLPSKLALNSFLIWQSVAIPKLENFVKVKPDIIHNHEWFTPPKFSSTKLVSTVFDLTIINNPEWHKPKNVKLQAERLKRINQADRIIAISESSKRDLVQFNPLIENKISVIYPGISDYIKPVIGREIKETLCKYKLNKPFILSVGTLEPRKNLKNLITAFIKAAEEIEDDLVIVGGEGWKTEDLHSVHEQTNRIRILDYIDTKSLNNLYNACHFFVYPSLYEGFGIPPLEALAVGKKVLVSNTSSLPEVVGNIGLQIDPNNVDSIYDGLRELSKLANGTQIYKDSLDQAMKFSYGNSAQKLISLYNSLK